MLDYSKVIACYFCFLQSTSSRAFTKITTLVHLNFTIKIFAALQLYSFWLISWLYGEVVQCGTGGAGATCSSLEGNTGCEHAFDERGSLNQTLELQVEDPLKSLQTSLVSLGQQRWKSRWELGSRPRRTKLRCPVDIRSPKILQEFRETFAEEFC